MKSSIYLTCYVFMLTVCIVGTSCKKFLDAKSNQKLSTPESLDDLQGLLDNAELYRSTVLLNTASDEYYTTASTLNSLGDPLNQNAYIWSLPANFDQDWGYMYRNLFLSNTVLDNLQKISAEGQEQKWNNVKGAALFYRSQIFLWMAEVYAKQYNEATAANDPGIVLRLNSNFNELSSRASLKATYDQIIADLNEASLLLSPTVQFRTRPSRSAALVLLARTYLLMGNYEKAKENGELAYNINNTLIDFNTVNPSGNYPSPINNTEILIYFRNDGNLTAYGFPYEMTDSVLINLYTLNDLRKNIFFKQNANGTYSFRGFYNEGFYTFNGIANDELYLILAEAHARLGNKTQALQYLDNLLVKRWKTGTYVSAVAADAPAALNLVLLERRKELAYRGLRWSDVRRYNRDGANITLKRVLNGQSYLLPPNDPRTVFLLPQQVIDQTGIPQNPR